MLRSALAVYALCQTMNGTAAPEPLIVAHRGASYDAPENTCAAFLLAWKQGADAVEGDFHLTKDGHIVCIHDATTKRTAGKDLKVAASTLAELRLLDAGSWKDARWSGERIPTLHEVLALVPSGKKVFLELKCGPEIVQPLKEALARASLGMDRIVVIAFDSSVVAEAKRLIPGLTAYWLTGYKRDASSGEWQPSLTDILNTLRRVKADGLDSEAHSRVGEPLARALEQAGYSLHVWTVDQPDVALRFVRLGVASITTNRPQWLREQMRRLLDESVNPRGGASRQ